MNEQRLNAYLTLIQNLLACPSGEELQLLQDNQDLLDQDFLQVLFAKSPQLQEAGRQQDAEFLINLAEQLSALLGKMNLPEDYFNFLMEVLQAVSESQGNPQIVYSLFQQNLDKLDENLADILTNWATDQFKQVSLETAENLAASIGTFANLIERFPLGSRKNNLEISIVAYQAILKIYTHEAFPEQWAMTQYNLAAAYNNRIKGRKADNIEQAIAAYQDALEIYTREAFPENWAMTQNNLAAAYRDRIKGEKADNIEQAIKGFRLALEIRTPKAFPLDCLKSGKNLGNTAFNAGLWEIAIEGYKQAIEAVEISRSWAMTDDRRQEIMAEVVEVYANIVQCYINLGQVQKAIEYAERSRSKRLVDLMASNDLYADGEIPPEVQKYLQDYDLLQQRIDQEREGLRREFDTNKTLAATGSRQYQRGAVEFSKDTIKQLEQDKQQIWEQIRRLDPVLSGQIQVVPLDFTTIQGLIETPKTAILNFYTTNNQTHIFILYQNQPPQLHTCDNLGYAELVKLGREEWLNTYSDSRKDWITNMGDFLKNLAKELDLNTLINRYLSDIEELIIIPHLFWHQIPFAALPLTDASESSSSQKSGEMRQVFDSFLRLEKPQKQTTHSDNVPVSTVQENSQYFGDKFRLRYVPSCQILKFCQERPQLNLSHYGTVENPDGTLPGASYEGEKIAKLYNIPDDNRLKGREQGTVKKYRKLLEQVQVFHSSHHASSRLDNPLESRLILADGTITLGQIMTPGWRLPQLSDIFLSCCETNLGFAKVTDDILTLSTGFLCAGARNVVSTLWAVNDLATALFSIFYYKNRKQGHSRSVSLQMAQVKLRGLTKKTLKNQYHDELEARFTQQFNQANAQRQQAKAERDKQSKGTPEYEQCQKEYQYWNRIATKNFNAKESLKDFCNQEYPFDHPVYWAGFICSGLA